MSELLHHLKTLIAFKTVGADAASKSACLSWIEDTFLSSAGVQLQRGDVRGSPYLFLQHPDPKLLWFGHIDVVPGSDEQFTLTVKGDLAYGRGVKDMKGADLTFLIAYKEACESGSIPPVSILLTSDEETGGYTPPALLEQKLLGTPPVAFTPDTGEADGIVTELKGALWVKLIADGKGGHGAYPWRAENPVFRLATALTALQEKFPHGAEDDWKMTVTPTKLHASDAFNRIPDAAECTLDVRFPPTVCKTPKEAQAFIEKNLPQGLRLEYIVDAYPMFCEQENPMVQRIKKIAEDVTGKPVPIRRECGSSDARAFVAEGIPAFLYGPIGGDLHGAGEWVSVKSLEEHVEINRRLLKELSL